MPTRDIDYTQDDVIYLPGKLKKNQRNLFSTNTKKNRLHKTLLILIFMINISV